MRRPNYLLIRVANCLFDRCQFLTLHQWEVTADHHAGVDLLMGRVFDGDAFNFGPDRDAKLFSEPFAVIDYFLESIMPRIIRTEVMVHVLIRRHHSTRERIGLREHIFFRVVMAALAPHVLYL